MFLRDGADWTSAGVMSGIDLALALIEQDCGAEMDRTVARRLVFNHQRAGGQGQYADSEDLNTEFHQIRATVGYASQNLAGLLSVERLAEVARQSPRHFSRALLNETGETAAKAVEPMRVVATRRRIETSQESIGAIAGEFGMNPERMRRAFLCTFGQPPQGIRRLARTGQAGADA